MQLAGFPSEVVDAVVSVICRMAFDLGLWSEGSAPLLLICEEAHRYASADRSIGFGPTRRSISRIAKVRSQAWRLSRAGQSASCRA
jgi:uncharacterized protein